MSSGAVNVRSGSTIARLPCNQRGSIGLSQGLFTGSRHTRIRTPPARFTVRLCAPIHARTARLTCQAALSHTSTHNALALRAEPVGPPGQKVRGAAADRAALDKAQQHSILVGAQQPVA